MRILSGIQPSGDIHLGNYFGMMREAIALQDQGQAIYFIADYHALTTVANPDDLRRYTREAALAFLACGLDPAKALLFRQSAIPEVQELAWLLSVVTPMGLLERAHSYKDKTAKGIAASHGLFAYPILMAADILLYQSDRVPVGKDQKQHVEMTRDIAQKFNDRFGAVFRLPEPVIREAVAAVPGLDGQKMSKSYGNTLELFGDPKVLQKKVMSLKTDSTPVEAPKPVEGSILADLYRLVAPEKFETFAQSLQAGGRGYGDYKKDLVAELENFLAPMRARQAEWAKEPGAVEEVLAQGAVRARALAEPTIQKAREAVGLK